MVARVLHRDVFAWALRGFNFFFHSPRCHFKYVAPFLVSSHSVDFLKLTESSPHNVLEATFSRQIRLSN